MNLNLQGLFDLFEDLKAKRIVYGWGDKLPLTLPISSIGTGTRCDCSGWTRYGVFRTTKSSTQFPDGSVQQHAYLLNNGLEPLEPSDGHQFGILFIFFLPPIRMKAGHTGFIYNGITYECHDGTPAMANREWGTLGWEDRCTLFAVPTH